MSTEAGGIHAFKCVRCGDIAATIEIVNASEPVNFGSGPTDEDMLIPFSAAGPHMRLTWLGVMVGQALPEVASLISGHSPIDPLELARLDWQLGAFCCRRCQANYCSGCWLIMPVFADDYPGWFEHSNGICPENHEQRLDD